VTMVPDGVVCVVCVVVMTGADAVIIVAVAVVGGGGGGPETTCDWGSDAHPTISPITLEIATNGTSRIARFLF
jgi:hypothetical protein